jgi:hypothetical protein
MFSKQDWYLGTVWIVLHLFIVAGWIIAIKYIEDPNKNIIRAFLILFHVLAIGLTLGHRAGWLENKQVIIDSRNADK